MCSSTMQKIQPQKEKKSGLSIIPPEKSYDQTTQSKCLQRMFLQSSDMLKLNISQCSILNFT